MSASDIGALGMIGMQTVLDTKAHNISASRVDGFKRLSIALADNPYVDKKTAGATSSTTGNVVPTGLQIGTGVRAVATTRIMTQGAPQQTGGTYDLAIEGKGHFQIELADGTTAYTRDGHFSLDQNRQIVDLEGRVLQPGLVIPDNATNVDISPDGIISATIAGQIDAVEVGTISLAAFPNPMGLRAIGGNLLVETTASGGPVEGNPNEDARGQIIQYALESSNVEMVLEMTDMLQAQRTYEACATVVKIGHETDRIDANLAG